MSVKGLKAPERTVDDFAKLHEAYPPADLHPDLEAALVTLPNGWVCIKHPLVFSMLHHPMANSIVNAQLAAKREAVAKAELEKRWDTYIFLHERPHRCEALMDIADDLSNEEYWRLVGSTWTDTENAHQCYDAWEELLGSERGSRESLMTDEELVALAKLPDLILIYRGFSWTESDEGYSWTLSIERAKWFARRYKEMDGHGSARIAVGCIDKPNVIAHFLTRGEDEIVALPSNVVMSEEREV